MESLIETIRAAVADGASANARAAGVAACRTILAALDATAGQPLGVPGAPGAAVTATSSAPAAMAGAALSSLGGMDPGTLLDLVIAKLKAVVPAESAATAKVRPLEIQLIHLPPGAVPRRRGK